MLCEKCQKNQATVQMQLRINGHQENHHLCPSCYREERQKLGTKMNGLNMNSMNPFSLTHSPMSLVRAASKCLVKRKGN